MKIACIIPIYNEEKRLENLLKIVSESKLFESIICIDDCSTDNSVKIVEKKFPNLKLIKHKKNMGKTEAIRSGLKKTNAKYVLLCDADLKGLTINDLKKAIKKTKKEKPAMVILRREKAPLINRLMKASLLITGERIINKKILEKIIGKHTQGFQLELVINKYILDNKLRYTSSPTNARSHHSFKKFGIVGGIRKEKKMLKEIFAVISPLEWLRQYLVMW
jgi:glycosyltransferase involved in cell wall biosynthesis